MLRRGRRFAAVNLAASLVAAAVMLTMAAPVSAAPSLTPVMKGLINPVYVTHPGDGTNRLFAVEQAGRIRVRLENATVATFLDIRAKVASGGERGLLGLAFHPDYERSGTWGYRRFYVYFTRASSNASSVGDIVLQEYKRSTTSANRADPASARTLLVIEHTQFSNHNGGAINFGPDRYLYVATGDGGGGGDPFGSGQNKNSLLGKLLRVSPRPSSTRPYTSPTSNPFYGSAIPGRGEVWSYGLRNPWRF